VALIFIVLNLIPEIIIVINICQSVSQSVSQAVIKLTEAECSTEMFASYQRFDHLNVMKV